MSSEAHNADVMESVDIDFDADNECESESVG